MRDDLIGRETPIHITKYDGSYHRRWPARFVTRKGPLYLLTCAPGDVVYEGGVPEDGTGGWPLRWAGDIFVWDDRWYNVGRNRRDRETWYYVNIATPVQFDGEQFHCIDLDLDVSWHVGEAPRVLDEDEFVAHSEAMRYPADVIERARAAVDEVLGLIGERAFPFDRT
jgi:hypothetical protein